MRIGIDARMLGSAPGIGRYIDCLLREFFMVDRENEYVLFLREPMYSRYRVAGTRIRKVQAPERWYGLAEQVTLPFRFWKAGLDLLFIPQFNVPLWIPCPLVVTIHDVTQLHMPGPSQAASQFRRWAFRLVFGNAVRSARAVIAVSEYTKREILKNFRCDPKKIHVIYEGAGLALLREGVSSSKFQILSFPYILAVGVWRPHKNFIGLIDAFALLRKAPNFSSLKLILAGEEDPRYPEVGERIRAYGLENAILTPGIVADVQLDQWYRFSRAVVIPSFYEGFGFVGLEALARHTPVVAARAAALPEILQDAARYCNPHDPEDMAGAIAAVLQDADERERILAATPAVLARYSWEQAARETLKIFETLESR